MPRLVTPSGLWPDCGQPIEDWRGQRAFSNYHFTAEPIADAVAQIAAGAGYREAARSLRLLASATSSSKEASLMQRLTEVLAPILCHTLAPQAWPKGGLLAVDAVRFNLPSRHRCGGEGDRLAVGRTVRDRSGRVRP